MTQTFDKFLSEYLDEQDETVRTEYEKAKEDLEDLLEKQSEFGQKRNSKAYIATTTSKKRR